MHKRFVAAELWGFWGSLEMVEVVLTLDARTDFAAKLL